MPEPGWELYRSFLATLREGSLSAAARRLGLTQPTLGRHIDQLEQMLGVALFTRSPQGLLPTAAALDLRAPAEAMDAAAAALIRTASGEAEQATGTIRLTASEVVGAEILPPILTSFRERHPAIALELVLSNRTEDLLRRDADLAIRMVRPTQSALVARRLGQLGLGLFAHRDYLERHGTPLSLDDLAAHAVIGFDRGSAVAPALAAAGLRVSRELFALRCDSDLGQLAALRAGFGVGGCQLGIARREPALVRLLPEAFLLQLEVWLVLHEDLRASRRIRLLADHLATELGDYVSRGPER